MTLPPVPADAASRLLARLTAANAVALGAYGIDFYADTATHTGNWGVIEVVTAATFTTLTIANSSGTFTGVLFQAGQRIYGDITAIDLTSGSIFAYRSE